MKRFQKLLAVAGLAAVGLSGALTAASAAPGTPLAGVQVATGAVQATYFGNGPIYQDGSYSQIRNRRYYGRPRVVCRIRYRWVRNVYGQLVRRPVRICTRRFYAL